MFVCRLNKYLPCALVVLTLEDNGNIFPDLVLDVLPGDCNKEAIVVTVLLAGIVFRDLKRLVNKGADGVFHLMVYKK